MSATTSVRHAPAESGGHDTSLRTTLESLSRLLPDDTPLVVGWQDAALGLACAGHADADSRLRAHLAEALRRGQTAGADPMRLVVLDAQGCVAVGLQPALRPDTRFDIDAWLGAACQAVAGALRTERARLRIDALESSRRLQRALYEITDLAGAELETQVILQRLHAIIGALMYAPNCYIVEYDDARNRVRFLHFADQVDAYRADVEREWGEEEMRSSLTFALLHHGQPLCGPSSDLRARLGIVGDEEQGPDSRDWLGVPMRRGDRICGAIVVQSYDRAGVYGTEEQALLGYVAQHVRILLDRRQAQAELERRVQERTLELQEANQELQEEVLERQRGERLQHALFRIAEMAVTSASLEQYYARVHASVDELLYARNFYIALLDPGREGIAFVYSVDEHGDQRPPRRLGRGITEYVIRHRCALLADRARIEALVAEGEIQESGSQARSWLGVPLSHDGEVVGVLAVQSYSAGIRFTPDDQRLLEFVAHNISAGLARQRAQDSLRAAHADLERRVAARTVELEEANERLLDQIGERLRAEQKLTHQARHDALTGLPNRTLLLERLDAAIDRARHGDGVPFAVLFLDLDRFKLVNDSIGHAAGDQLLIEVARRIVPSMRGEDLVARLGGDEFAILLTCPDGPSGVREVAQRMLGVLGQPMWVAGRELFPSASMGIAFWHPRYRSGEELLRDADAAMYRAKASGRDRHAVFDEAMREEAMRSLDLEADLRRAIKRRDFLPHYQPIVRLEDGVVVGYEALLRWRHERRGLLGPDAFIVRGQETGLIEQVDWLLYEQVVQALACGGTGYVSVNVSPRHFHSPDFADRLLGLLAAADADPRRLRVEITEVALLDDAPRTLRILSTLRENGVLAQLDDFGTGFSALSYLHRFPISGLKIDRSFVAGLDAEGRRGESLALVRAILAMAGTLGIDTVGEGVETAAQRDTLRQLGCHSGQGYLFGRPTARMG